MDTDTDRLEEGTSEENLSYEEGGTYRSLGKVAHLITNLICDVPWFS